MFRLILVVAVLLVVRPSFAQDVSGGKLPTRWDAEVSPTHPWPQYPRPQMTRSQWINLNGPWQLALTEAAQTQTPSTFPGHILVPYPYESALSGVNQPSPTTQRLWYRRTVTVPAAWTDNHQRVLLHFGAVNWDSTVFINGHLMGDHKGGYDGFSYDITDALRRGGNSVVVSAQNPLRHDQKDGSNQIIGKQRDHPSGIFYTASTGIWQTVWLEPVAATHIAHLVLTPDIDAGVLHVTAQTEGTEPVQVKAVATDAGRVVGTVTGSSDTALTLPVPRAHLWSPDDPHLYDLTVTLLHGSQSVDRVGSYFGMRKISIGRDANGITRILLNNRFVFERGVLNQGYWPDGEYTPPTDAAMRNDIVMTKQFGFNMCRKHAKVEPDRWYYWADKLGELVWQDMPQAFGTLNDAAKAQFQTELTQLIHGRRNHPSIIMWTLFNEGWGQHDTKALTDDARQLDPSRLINSASGGYNQMRGGKMSQYRLPTPSGYGDVIDTHVYPDPSSEKPDETRAAVVGEFGGISMRVPGHDWNAANFGYGAVMNDGWHLTQHYQHVLQEAYALRDDPGVSAVVYTQLTDVEDETNGLLTYDRAVVKPISAIVAAANTGTFLPLPPAPPIVHILVPTSRNTPQTWAYTDVQPVADWFGTGFDASAWKTGPAPFGQGYDGIRTPWTDTPGDIWLRRDFSLPADIPAHLDVLMQHDEDAEVYVNGVLAASATGYNGNYDALPMSETARTALHPGQNLLAVHCHQTIGGQFIDVGIEKAP